MNAVASPIEDQPQDTPPQRRVRVFMVASSFPENAADWRAVFIRQLAEGLSRHHLLDLTMWAPLGDAAPEVLFDLRGDDERWLRRLMAEGGIAHLLRNSPLRAVGAAIGLLRRLRAAYTRNAAAADVYHVNWLQNALALPDDGKPLLLTALGTDLALLKLAPVRIALRKILSRHPTVICPNAGWMAAPLQEALGDISHIQPVAFGLDKRWFAVARRTVQAPHRWLAVTRVTRGKIGTLFDWGEAFFATGRRELHLIGPMQEDISLPAWVHYHGPQSPEALRTEWFPNAAGLLTLSQHTEGRPQVILEAMAAGLPVVASDLQAHADCIVHGSTGWIAASQRDLGKGLECLEGAHFNAQVGEASRRWVQAEMGTWDDCADRYNSLYRFLLSH